MRLFFFEHLPCSKVTKCWDVLTLTYHLWKPTLAKKMVSINGNGFLSKGDGFPLQCGGFPLQGYFGQNLKSCFSQKFGIFLNFFRNVIQTTCAGNNYMQSKPTNFFFEYF